MCQASPYLGQVVHINLGVKLSISEHSIMYKTSSITLVLPKLMLPGASKAFLNLHWLSSHLWSHVTQILRPALRTILEGTMIPTFGCTLMSPYFISTHSLFLYLVIYYSPLKLQYGYHHLVKMSLPFHCH